MGGNQGGARGRGQPDGYFGVRARDARGSEAAMVRVGPLLDSETWRNHGKNTGHGEPLFLEKIVFTIDLFLPALKCMFSIFYFLFY